MFDLEAVAVGPEEHGRALREEKQVENLSHRGKVRREERGSGHPQLGDDGQREGFGTPPWDEESAQERMWRIQQFIPKKGGSIGGHPTWTVDNTYG